jgi:hypothetical protein
LNICEHLEQDPAVRRQAFVSEEVKTVLLQQRLQAEARVPCVVMRLLVFVPDERHGEQDRGAGLENTGRLAKEFIGIEDVLENLIAQRGIEARIVERESPAIVKV